ncbi:hypothetical protein Arub01_30700 [Actinomadura rubrobrunea]|uniref:LapA family protein n=1 Tax=Actinomadura rubrobrunea TaxID=115335 RepID=A0A9W6PX66_9ACTN|nr:hypothetical protein [Actinomadura rubrobrunea]GLW64826.1 hypothetical protein Arub01_30700 [Actinomadura rubrobrunea]
MAFIGFVLVAAAVVVGAGVALDNPGDTTLTVFGTAVPGVNALWQVFFAGAAVAVVFVIGLVLTFTGIARRVRTRREIRSLREEHEESLTTLEREKRQLQRELDRIRGNAPISARRQPSQGATPAPSSAPTQVPVAGARAGSRPQISASSPFFDRTD